MFVFDNGVSDISPVLGLALFMDGIIEYSQDSKIIFLLVIPINVCIVTLTIYTN